MLIFFIVSIGVSMAHAQDLARPECKALEQTESARLPTATLKEFDYTMGSGWRVLADNGCVEQAETLIAKYIELHGEQSSLRVHLGQMELRLGKKELAAINLTKSLRSNEAHDAAFKFNDFISALIAYARNDEKSFNSHYQVVKEHDDNFGNKQNLRLLTAISLNFNRPYNDILDTLRPAH